MILEGWKECRILLDGCLDFVDVGYRMYDNDYWIVVCITSFCFRSTRLSVSAFYFYPIKSLIDTG